ncbi:MAG: flagellar M-ring protein FliF, partial [Ruminococcus sp.]|jgi:flagellar basal-body M-ring protein/flagellar hook-basal body protein fliF|nr:flagellar M-ring protein FliF [Ruminococcus sp.]
MGYGVELRTDGNIYVESGTENTIAMQLAQEGYPQDTIPYDDYINNIDMFTTESEKQQYLIIAKENRMSKIVSSLDCLTAATVTLTVPPEQNTVITTLRQKPTASVYVTLKSDVDKLSDKQIQGIKNIVKAASAGLSDEDIEIVDSAGIPQIIMGDASGTDIEKLTQRFAYKTRLENDIKTKIDALLTPAFGAEGYAATVNMWLNFDSDAREEINYSPDDTRGNTGVTQSESSSSASGSTITEGGVAGEEQNTEEYPEGADVSGNGAWTENSVDKQYVVDQIKRQVVKDGYTIDGLSIAVVVYTDFLSEIDIENIRSLVAQTGTITLDIAEDVVSVAYFQKIEDVLDDALAEDPSIFLGLTVDDLIFAGAFLAIILILLTMMMILRSVSAKRRRTHFEKKVLESGQFNFDEDAPDEIEQTLFNLHRDKPDVEIPSLIDDGVETKEIIIRKEISNFARHSPEIVATLLRNWMKEEEEEVPQK